MDVKKAVGFLERKEYENFFNGLRGGLEFNVERYDLKLKLTKKLDDYEKKELAWLIARNIYGYMDVDFVKKCREHYFPEDKRLEIFHIETNGKKVGVFGSRYHENKKVVEFAMAALEKDYRNKSLGTLVAKIMLLKGIEIDAEWGITKSDIPRTIKHLLDLGFKSPLFTPKDYPKEGKGVIESLGHGVNRNWILDMRKDDFFSHAPLPDQTKGPERICKKIYSVGEHGLPFLAIKIDEGMYNEMREYLIRGISREE